MLSPTTASGRRQRDYASRMPEQSYSARTTNTLRLSSAFARHQTTSDRYDHWYSTPFDFEHSVQIQEILKDENSSLKKSLMALKGKLDDKNKQYEEVDEKNAILSEELRKIEADSDVLEKLCKQKHNALARHVLAFNRGRFRMKQIPYIHHEGSVSSLESISHDSCDNTTYSSYSDESERESYEELDTGVSSMYIRRPLGGEMLFKSDLQRKCKDKDNDIEKLKSQVRVYEDQINELQVKLHNTSRTHNLRIDELNKQLMDMEKKMKTEQAKHRNKSYADSEPIKQLKIDNRGMDQAWDEHRKTVDELTSQLQFVKQTLKKEQDSHQYQVNKLRRELEVLRLEKQQTFMSINKTETDALYVEINQLKRSKDKVDEQMIKSKENSEKLLAENANYRSNSETDRELIDRLQTIDHERKQALDENQTQFEELTKQLRQVQHQFKQEQDQVSKLRRKLEVHSSEKVQLLIHKEDTDAEINRLKRTNVYLETKLNEHEKCRGQSTKAKDQSWKLHAENTSYRNNSNSEFHDRLQRDNHEMKNAQDENLKKVDELTKELQKVTQQLAQEHDSHQNQVNKLQKEMEVHQNQYKDMVLMNRKDKDALHAELGQVKQIKTDIEAKQDEHDMRKRQIAKTDDQCKLLIAENARYKRKSDTDRDTIDRLQNHNYALKLAREENQNKIDKLTKQLRQEKESLKQEQDSHKSTISKLRRELEILKNNQMKDNETEALHAEISQLKRLNTDLEAKQLSKQEIHQRQITKTKEQYETEKADNLRKINLLRREVESLKKNSFQSSDSKHTDSDIKRQLERARKDLQDTRDELDETKSRLSKLMGQKLTDNNPNIADLSDKNRPTKLAERYTELYDNQWTDAFEEIDRGDEHKTIEILHKILEDALMFCMKEASDQLQSLTNVVLFTQQTTGQHVPALINKQLKDCRKAASDAAGNHLYQLYLQKLRGTSSPIAAAARRVPKYLKECFSIGWLMSIQDPPVVLERKLRRGDAFNTDIYKAYTHSGPKVEYVVWPAMYLHDGGAILCKGVAQGCKF